jgi:transcriptional regulator with XRE-family HTH domain
MTARELFGPGLRQQRERQGLTLAAVADNTKISPHLLTALERGDVSRWPGGLYRRAFVRAYAAAVGLPPEPTVVEFVRLFPEPGQDLPDHSTPLPDDDPRRLRLTLVTESPWKAPLMRSVAALVDAGVVISVAVIVSAATRGSLWMPATIAGLAYHATGAILLGHSPGTWLVTSSVASAKPRTIQDQFARLRQGWAAGLMDSREGNREHPAAT